MAVGMLMAGEGVTREAYVQITEKMFGAFPMPEAESPDGLIVHTAGQGDQGWYIYDIWESRQHFDRFIETKLGPAMRELVGEGGPRPEPQFFPIEILEKGPAL